MSLHSYSLQPNTLPILRYEVHDVLRNSIPSGVLLPPSSDKYISRPSDKGRMCFLHPSAVTYPRGEHGGHGPSLSALRGPSGPEIFFFLTLDKTFTQNKNLYQSSIHVPLVTRGAPMGPMGPCSHPRAPGFLGPWPPRGPW